MGARFNRRESAVRGARSRAALEGAPGREACQGRGQSRELTGYGSTV